MLIDLANTDLICVSNVDGVLSWGVRRTLIGATWQCSVRPAFSVVSVNCISAAADDMRLWPAIQQLQVVDRVLCPENRRLQQRRAPYISSEAVKRTPVILVRRAA